jgi:hypothetical protein
MTSNAVYILIEILNEKKKSLKLNRLGRKNVRSIPSLS